MVFASDVCSGSFSAANSFPTIADCGSLPMAASSPAAILQSESICAICLDFFTDPVVTGCGHNYCRACIEKCLEEPETGSFSCPQCRQIGLLDKCIPNRLLVSIVEAAKRMEVTQSAELQVGSVCELHNEELKLYCHDDEKLICTVCDRSKEHRYHSVLPIEEAAEDYKKSFQHNLVNLRSKLEASVKRRRSDEDIITYLKNEIETQRRLIKSEMENLHKFLNEQEEVLLHKLVMAESSVSMFDKQIIAKTSEKIDRLNELILKIETSYQQPAKELMKDAKNFLNRIHEELQEEGNLRVEQCVEDVYRDRHGVPICPRIYEELQEEGNLTVAQCVEEVYRERHAVPICPRTPEEHSEDTDEDMNDKTEKAEEHQRKSPKRSRFVDRMREILPGIRSKKEKPQAPGNTMHSHAADQKTKAKVIYDYEAADENELSIVEGDIIADIDMVDKGWWYGVCNGKYGLFPANYVTLL